MATHPYAMKHPTYRLQVIEWLDSQDHSGDDWVDLQPHRLDLSLQPVYSVGWIVAEDAQTILVTPHLAMHGTNAPDGRGGLKIPKFAITDRQTIRWEDGSHFDRGGPGKQPDTPVQAS